MFPLKLDEVEIAAGVAVGVIAADLRTALINCAAALALIKKHAHRFVDGVFTVPQNAHRFAFVRHLLGELFTCHAHRDRVMLRQPGNVAWLGFDVVVTTAIAGTFTAIERIFCGHDMLFSKISRLMLMECRRAVIIPSLDCEFSELSVVSQIELRGVGKLWGDVVALSPTSLRILKGSFTVLLGPSGCGKTTTLRLIAGLDSASAGQILIDGRDVTNEPPSHRNLAMVFQNYALFPHLTVADNIVFGLQVRKASKQEQSARLARVLALLGLEKLHDRKPSQLSGGQQQRVALARALVAEAKICLMDEPLSNLDAQLRQEMRQELRALQQKLGLTVIYVTHDQAEAMSMADQVVLLNRGRIEQVGSPREIYARPATFFAARFIGTPPMSVMALEDDAIKGTRSALQGKPSGATHAAIRPEHVTLGGDIHATINASEYLGADSLIRCQIGSEQVAVRIAGQRTFDAGQAVQLAWSSDALHYFDNDGQRVE